MPSGHFKRSAASPTASSSESKPRAREIERHLTLAAESRGRSWRRRSRGCTLLARAAERPDSPRSRTCRRRWPSHGRHPEQVRVAAVDLGTNSTRLLVADANGTLEEVVRRLAITRLGEGVDERRRLLPLPIARVRNVLSDYRRELEQLGAERTLCIATSAVRDAENGEAFLGEIEWSYGFTTRLLTGEEEAALTLRGIGAVEPGTLVVDIGGGSTELQVTGTDLRVSLDIGCVRLTERFGEDVEAIRRARAQPAAARERGPRRRRRRHGDDDRRARPRPRRVRPGPDPRARDLERSGRRAAGAARGADERGAGADRRARPRAGDRRGRGDPRRDPRRLRLDAIEASERDILHGAALAAAELPEPEEGAAPPGAYTCC